VTAQYESEVVYTATGTSSPAKASCSVIWHGPRSTPTIVKRTSDNYPANDNKFAALNSAVMVRGSFIYVPPGVKVRDALQAYFRINTENMGQFERTLIIADEGAQVHYIEGARPPVLYH